MDTKMDVKAAVDAAKSYVNNLLIDEGLMNLGLEEVEFDETNGFWLVTVGFSRPWNTTRGPLATLGGENAAKRAYRVVTVRDSDGEVLSVKRSKELAYA